MNLYMVMLGCTPPGRNTEQHDIFFGIANSLAELKPAMRTFWPEGKARLHADAIRVVRKVDGMQVQVAGAGGVNQNRRLYFINMGGYRNGDFTEYHETLLTIQDTLAKAKAYARRAAFYRGYSAENAPAHIDNKYVVAIDEAADVSDILPIEQRRLFTLTFTPAPANMPDDEIYLGYFLFNALPVL